MPRRATEGGGDEQQHHRRPAAYAVAGGDATPAGPLAGVAAIFGAAGVFAGAANDGLVPVTSADGLRPTGATIFAGQTVVIGPDASG